jgi:signal transduction histidine kinase/CHASE3 domain sensor protein
MRALKAKNRPLRIRVFPAGPKVADKTSPRTFEKSECVRQHITREQSRLGPSLPGSAERRVLAVVPALLVVLIGALAYERARSVVADVREVDRSHAVIETSDAILTRAIDAETAQRAYLLTGQETFLGPYRGARADIAQYLDSLRRLIRGDQPQSARLNTIEKLVPERFALLDLGIAQRRNGVITEAMNVNRLLAGKKTMDQLRAVVANLRTHEWAVLEERRAAEQQGVRNASIAIGSAVILAFLLSTLVNLAFSRAVQDRDAANTSLRHANEDLEQQSNQLETQAVEMESQAAELEATADDLRETNDELNRAITQRKREQQGAVLLAEASRVLASTLDYEKTLDTVARLAVGELADWCSVALVQTSGGIRQAVVSHVDEEKIRWAKELNKRYPADYSAATGVGHVIRMGQPELYPEITDEMLVATAKDREHLAIMRELQIKSALIVPMIARGRTLGALTLISTQKGRRYGEADLTLAMEIATRAAIAIDNAQLYRSTLAASEAKSTFLATMSHELRTPLNAIIGYQSLLKEGIDGSLNETQLAQLSRIRAGADHLLTLIDEILTYSRVEAGKEVVRLDEADFRPIVEDAVTMVKPLARSKGLTVRVDVPDARLVTDVGKLRQILVNILSNAVKFTDSGEITLRGRLNGDEVAFSVSDTGIGIATENQQRIFEPFWQVEQSSTRRAGGTGLGLTVSRSLARLLGGEVSVVSKLGDGSTFTLTLPLRRA